jgi:hypothetical protein
MLRIGITIFCLGSTWRYFRAADIFFYGDYSSEILPKFKKENAEKNN